jgi:hypothetical protein
MTSRWLIISYVINCVVLDALLIVNVITHN